MNGQLLILALAAVGVSCVQAGLAGTQPVGEQFPVRVPPSGYSDFPPAPAAPFYGQEEFYQDEHPAHAQHQQQQQQQQQPQQPQPNNGQAARRSVHRLTHRLHELGKIGAQSARQAFNEARPTLDGMRSDFNEIGQGIIKDPRVQKVTNSLGAHFEQARNRAVPLLQRGKSQLDRARGHLRPQGPYEPASVYPVPPPNAVNSQQ